MRQRINLPILHVCGKNALARGVREVSSYVELLLIPFGRHLKTAFAGRNFVSEKLAATEAIQELPAAFRRPLHPDNFAALVTVFPEAEVAFRSPKHAAELEFCAWEPFSAPLPTTAIGLI